MRRRANGEGSIFFDRTKNIWRWKGFYINSNGEKKNKTFSAKKRKDLNVRVSEFFAELKNGIQYEENITVDAWIDTWLETFVKKTVKPTTYGIYKQKTNYVRFAFGKRKLKTLTTVEVQNFFKQLLIDGGKEGRALSPTTVNGVRRYFRICCDVAVESKIIDYNPVKATKALRERKREITVMDEHEVRLFLEVAAKGDYIYEGISDRRLLNFNKGTEYLIKCYNMLVNLALATGMRISEMRGLSWDDVYFSQKYIDINKQLVQTIDNDLFDEPKTENSCRKLKLDQHTLKLLDDFFEYQKQYSDYLGDLFDNQHNLVFTNTLGKPFSLSNFRRRYFNKMLIAAGIDENFTIHSMRHTHATLLLKKGINPKVVSKRLGHSNVTITLNIYAHVLESMENTASDMWGEIMNCNHSSRKNY